MFNAAFTGGYTLSFWVADVATGEAKEFWHALKDEKDFSAVNAITWTDADHVIFEAEPQEWTRWYSVRVTPSTSDARPVELTPGEGAVEQTALSADGRFLFYSTNAGDIERRHVWKVPTAGGTAEALTHGETIETSPVALASGSRSPCSAAMRSGRSASASCRRQAALRNTSIPRSTRSRSTPKSYRNW